MNCEKCNREYDDALSSCPYCAENNAEETETSQSAALEDFNDSPSPSNSPNVNENLFREPILQEQKETPPPIQTNNFTDIKQPPQAIYMPQQTNPQVTPIRNDLFCKYCGGTINQTDNYCLTCGRSSVNENIRHCPKCGFVIPLDTAFCQHCGNKITYNKNAAKLKSSIDKRKKTIIAVIVAVLTVALVIGTGVGVMPKVFASPYKIMEEADYERAYKHANKSERNAVLFENIIAVCCSDIKTRLKDPNSFLLRKVFIEDDKSSIVLYVGAKNGFGGMANSYYLYTNSSDSDSYDYYNNVSDFDKESYSYYDDYSERTKKIIDNYSKSLVYSIITDDSTEITNGIVDRINNLNQNGKLDDVKLIDEAKKVRPNKSNKSDKSSNNEF